MSIKPRTPKKLTEKQKLYLALDNAIAKSKDLELIKAIRDLLAKIENR